MSMESHSDMILTGENHTSHMDFSEHEPVSPRWEAGA